ncbi:terminase small subunit [Dactylosporangium sp. CA-052675]|uniref:terminase small subunit n=1 Tax=Dactylosporangium sp. CA-052675 TaxID=3239927 RepID=UPI003D8BCF35
MAPRRNLASVPDTQRERPPDLRDAVRGAVDAMDWLTPTDYALRALALRMAEQIEEAVDRADELRALQREFAGDESATKRLKALEAQCDMTKAVGWLGPQLQGVLRDLGGTPKGRAELNPDKPVGSRLAALRDAAKDR